jgi:sigma-54 specific flagellar transcriptional regulator A
LSNNATQQDDFPTNTNDFIDFDSILQASSISRPCSLGAGHAGYSLKGLHAIIGRSAPIQAVRSLIQAVARSGSTVLILGESGTGKELVARALHDLSDRSGASFVPVNCAAIPKELIESELFGHRKGSFTGALADRVGRFELAHGGTLFLDEIGDLSLDMQVKLLRVLQERSIDPIGSSRTVPIDVRIIAATHRDIEGEIASGHFRQDLFYRLNVLPIEMPPLRIRLDDLPDLADSFARRHANPGKSPVTLAPDLLNVLQCYEWPGNVRELSNLMDRFSVLYPGRRLGLAQVPLAMLPRGLRPFAEQQLRLAETAEVTQDLETPAQHETLPGLEQPFGEPTTPGMPGDPGDDGWAALQTAHDMASTMLLSGRPQLEAHRAAAADTGYTIPPEPQSVEDIVMMVQDPDELPEDGLHLKQHLADIERSLIRQALDRSGGNISQTARLLRLQRTTLIEKINKYDLRAASADD